MAGFTMYEAQRRLAEKEWLAERFCFDYLLEFEVKRKNVL
jgi:hypothetical protein